MYKLFNIKDQTHKRRFARCIPWHLEWSHKLSCQTFQECNQAKYLMKLSKKQHHTSLGLTYLSMHIDKRNKKKISTFSNQKENEKVKMKSNLEIQTRFPVQWNGINIFMTEHVRRPLIQKTTIQRGPEIPFRCNCQMWSSTYRTLKHFKTTTHLSRRFTLFTFPFF